MEFEFFFKVMDEEGILDLNKAQFRGTMILIKSEKLPINGRKIAENFTKIQKKVQKPNFPKIFKNISRNFKFQGDQMIK